MSRARGRGHAIIALLALIACDRAPEQPAPTRAPAVTVVPVAQRRIPVYGQYVGQTVAVQTVDVRARVEGYLDRQAVPDGATVKAGDLLFVIDPRPFRIALDSARAQLAREQADSSTGT